MGKQKEQNKEDYKMIKELIKDLTFDNISLTKALTRAKLLAYKIGDNAFKKWIHDELNGYSSIEDLPDYRIIFCDLIGKIYNPFHGERKVPIDVTSLDKQMNGKIYNLSVFQSISTLERLVSETQDEFRYESLPQNIVQHLREITETPELVEVYRRIHFTQLTEIINQTKQKLIDTLLELNDNFPNLEDDFKPSKEDIKKANTIINTNIYGNKVNSNIGVGNDFSQNQSFTDNSENIEQKLKELKELGVDEKLINEVRDIVKTDEEKSTISKKLMNWVGKVASNAAEKGIMMNIPLIIEKVQALI